MKLDKGTIVCLAGDFNFPDIIWGTLSLKKGAKYPSVSRRFIKIIQEQLVTEPTSGRNTLDLFLTTHPTLVNKVTMTPGISYNDGIPMIDLSSKPKTNRPPPTCRKIYQFHKADNESIKQDLRNLSDTMTNRNNSEATSTCLWKEFKDGVLKAIDQGSSIILAHMPQEICKVVQSATKCHRGTYFLLFSLFLNTFQVPQRLMRSATCGTCAAIWGSLLWMITFQLRSSRREIKLHG